MISTYVGNTNNHSLIDKAIDFATNAHKDQLRKETEIPYITHPLGVGEILARFHCPEDLIVAGILHDCLEDTPITIEQIRSEFGDNIAQIVLGCSEPNKNDTWQNRKRHTVEFLKTAPQEVRLVSCADKLHNLECIIADYRAHGKKLWERFRAGKENQKWYYSSLGNSFEDDQHPIFQEFKSKLGLFLTIVE